MKNTKNIFLIIIIILLAIIVAGMYKFNYLSGKKGYDVDGNKLTHKVQKTDLCDEDGNRYRNEEEARKAGLDDVEFGATYCPEYKMHPSWDTNHDGINDCYETNSCSRYVDYMLPYSQPGDVHDFTTCVQGGGIVKEKYPDQCVYDGDMVFVRGVQDNLEERLEAIHAVVELNEQGQRELVFPDFPVRPIKALSVDERNDFQNAILAETGGKRTREAILSAFPELQEEDFANTGNLQDDIDFQILLNNYLERAELDPQNGEHLEVIIADLKKAKDHSDEDLNGSTRDLTTLHIPQIDWNEDGTEKITYMKYRVPHTTAVLKKTLERLFEVSGDKDTIWNGLQFDRVVLDNGVAKIYLKGAWYPDGDMSGYYFGKLINAAAFYYPSVNAIEVFINEEPFDWCMDDESDGESGCLEEPHFWRVTRDAFEKES